MYINHWPNFHTWLYSAKILFVSSQVLQKSEIANRFELWISYHLGSKEISLCFILTGHMVGWMFVFPPFQIYVLKPNS